MSGDAARGRKTGKSRSRVAEIRSLGGGPCADLMAPGHRADPEVLATDGFQAELWTNFVAPITKKKKKNPKQHSMTFQ